MASPIPPALICTSITEVPGGFLRVEWADSAMIPATGHHDMTPEAVEAAGIAVEGEVVVDIRGVWTSKAAGPGGCTK